MGEPPPIPPAGAVTFLFTDIEGSTRLWERNRKAMWRALERHNAIIGEAIRVQGGWHFKTVGDAFQVAFADPAAAVAVCVAAQRALATEPWPETGPLRVRMALHRGEADPTPTGDYHAPSLHRLAPLLAAGHGGQVLLSAAARAAVGGHLAPGVTLRSLGRHQLRDLLAAEEIWQLDIPGLPATFPPLKSLEAFPTNLPQQAAPVIGREAEVAGLRALLVAEEPRLLTLTGPGGVGKTRLALATASEALEAFPDGVFLVSLAAVEDAALLLAEIAGVLGVREGGGQTLAESVRTYLDGKRVLLVLDNLEQLRPFEQAAATVASLMDAAPSARVLATSRAPLRVRAEREFPVPPLPTPDVNLSRDASGLAMLTDNPAVALFVARARAARPAWRLTPANAEDVAEIARRLDGLPLALELAAARIRVLAPADILQRLGDALGLLAARGGDRPDRQQTLRAAIAWSHDLLGFVEQAAFRRLGVFSGGFTLEAAEQLLAAAPDPWVDGLDAVALLVEQSLLHAEEDADGEGRYRMLETVRAFAAEELDGSRESAIVRAAHATWVEQLARDADRRLLGAEGAALLTRLEREHDNFRSALAWAIAHRPDDLGLRLPESLWRFWELRGHYAEARAWLSRSLTTSQQAPSTLRAQALDGLGNIAWRQGDLRAAAEALEESLRLRRESDDPMALVGTLTSLGTVSELRGDLDRARALQEEAVVIAREIADPWKLATALNNLALVVSNQDETELATALLEESVAIKRQTGNLVGTATSLNNLAVLMVTVGQPERAITYLEETLAIDRQIGSPSGIADSLANLASVIVDTGDVARSAGLDAEALELRRDLGDRISIAYSIENIAATSSRAGQAETGARLFGAAERLREELEAPLPPSERQRYDEGVALSRSALPEPVFAQSWAAGRVLTLDDVIAEALHAARQVAKPAPASV
jgi:predicted ATPase/class 3 adenylate cyclase